MRILGIETSCDETAAAVIEANPHDKTVKLVTNVIASSLPMHAKTGGIIPETAARAQIQYILPVIKQALKESILTHNDIDTIAITYGPGLIGSLLVGVETAKTLSYIWKKPLVPVNHLIGHIYANFIDSKLNADIEFPALALIVSGGHTDLVLLKDHGKIKWLGGTRDDAAGEAFDKIGRLLNLSYPGGPAIEKAAELGNPKVFNFPRPLIGSDDFDFSFSGLKTAVFREVKTIKKLNNEIIADLSASIQQAIIDVLIKKTLKASEKYNIKSLLLSGGVAANQKIKEEFALKIEKLKLKISLSVPPKNLCTDNGAMIAAAAFFNYKEISWKKLTANPELYFD
ncbi:MAG: tRNA (adenosine(37)-N6)-threonylcarbamoyltransferase complex transferase subunit TsaD [Candidatus Levyibacteriota bacterium]|nr:MAG: tRNA (adenosine(37)-N6)-threonylcarbamoyltransferase complex transferase subunit TsaD [Candidatus Levybacteria bacterium]